MALNQSSITKFFSVEVASKEHVPGDMLSAVAASSKVPIPESFPFPFEAYSIQERFMRKLYETLADGKLGIFESPTGTGKSMSIICGSLAWLRDFEDKKRHDLQESMAQAEHNGNKENVETTNDSSVPNHLLLIKASFFSRMEVHAVTLSFDWITQFAEKKKVSDKLIQLKTELNNYQKLDEKVKNLRSRKQIKREVSVSAVVKDFPHDLIDDNGTEDCDDEFLLKEYVSDDEKYEKSSELDEDDLIDDSLQDHVTKIYFCSRTHSQLTQFANEVKKSPFANDVRLIYLGSRQNSCVNETVQTLKSLSIINDRCREMQKNKVKTNEKKVTSDGKVLKKSKCSIGGCSFYNQTRINELRDLALVDVKDIEELAEVGRKLKACPYYASRHAQPMAQLVLLPYNMLFHKQTREASGISLKGNVVIVDEAHNLLDAISAVHSSQVTGSQISGALSQLAQYKSRYSSRLKAKNVLYIQQIIFVLTGLLKYLKGLNPIEKMAVKASQKSVKMHTLNEFILNTGLDNINLFKLLRYCQRSAITRKLLGFSTTFQPTVKTNGSTVSAFLEKLTNITNETSPPTPEIPGAEVDVKVASSPLMQILEFLRCLTNSDHDGRVIMYQSQQSNLESASFKYYLLNPATHFQDIVADARAIVVAGGTMQPVDEFSDQLFKAAGAQEERIIHFSCGHVIPSNHLLAAALAQGPSGIDFDFSYQNRNSVLLVDELGRFITNVCNVVPGGIVCFFPSYDYSTQVMTRWETTKILSKIGLKKQVFQEPRTTNIMGKVLTDYANCVTNSRNTGKMTGAILFSVVGGKMSEGINFSDDLGRCVIMIGMPYPNINSIELQEKMQHLNATMSSSKDGCRKPGQIYYENLCMKAVNQSIGRAIRHRLDYAAILLLDTRYSKPSVQTALPGWIRNHLKTYPKFGPCFALIRKFFIGKSQKQLD